MANLTSTVPAAFDQFLTLLQSAASGQNPAVFVVDTVLAQYEPATYVELSGAVNHRYESAALGSYAFYETYELEGFVRVFLGQLDHKAARDQVWQTFQSIVMAAVVANRTLDGLVEYIEPASANYSGGVSNIGGSQAVIEFAFSVQARLTV